MKKYFEIEMTADNFGLYAIEGVREVLIDRIAIYKFRNDVSVFGYDNETIFIKMPHNPVELNSIMVSLLNRDIDSELMYCFRAKEITVEAREPLAWTLDGENGGIHEKAVIRNLHHAIDIRVETDED